MSGRIVRVVNDIVFLYISGRAEITVPLPLPEGPDDPPNPQEMRKDHQKKKVEYKDKKREIGHQGMLG